MIPDLERTLELADLVAYAGATWDWHRMHYDREAAAALGLPAPVVDGQHLGALLAEHAQDGLGPRARVVEMSFRFSAPVFAGETVRINGTVERSEGRAVITQELRAGDRAAILGAKTTVELR